MAHHRWNSNWIGVAALLGAGLTIARYTVLEALRNRLLWLLIGAAAGAFTLGVLLDALALTESRQLQAALLVSQAG